MNTSEGVWLSIVDYSKYKNVSISTIRRHIKSEILRYKEENGKYFIYVNSIERVKVREESDVMRLKLELVELRKEINKIKEENNELKMLVDLYEKKSPVMDEEIPLIPEFLL